MTQSEATQTLGLEERLEGLEPASNETSTSPSGQWELHLAVTPTWGDRTLSTSSRQWKALRSQILLRDNRTCASCGYISPDPQGRAMVVDHKDGNASNNDPSNLRVHCPPCEAIRHCGFAGMKGWIVLGESSMDQVEVVRKTRAIFERSGVVPHPKDIDRSVTPVVDMCVVDLANKMLGTPWEELPDEYRRFRGFFTKYGARLFGNTMSVANEEPQQDDIPSPELNRSGRLAAEILAAEQTLPWVRYSQEYHKTSQAFLHEWRPSMTSGTEVAWICVNNPRVNESEDETGNLDALSDAWDEICAQELASIPEVDKLAQRFNVLSGKWLVFASIKEVDDLWARIVKATLAGTLGTVAKVSPRDETDHSNRHVICIYNADYRVKAEVDKVRDGLRRLGMRKQIGYKPDIYTHCRIYAGNSWGIKPTRYHS